MRFANPILKAREITSQYHYKDNNELLSKLIRDHDIDLDYWPFKSDFSGMLWYPCPDRPTIVINTNHSLGRQNFTLGHELGHFFLNHGTQACSGNGFKDKRSIEKHTNSFAAELLMPRDVIEKYINKGYTLIQMANFFIVSKEAMQWRLKSLHLLQN